MDSDIIIIYAVAIIGIIMIFLTRFVAKGRSRDMTRLWFITFFAFMVYYILAKSYGYYEDTRDIVYAFGLLWPIAGILAFWIAELITRKGAQIAFIKWMVYFVVGIAFAFVLDGVAGIFQLYKYSQDVLVDKTWLVNPIGGLQVPSLMLLLPGILMLVVFFLVFNVYKLLRKRRIDDTSATLLLSALSIVVVGFLWEASILIVSFIKSMM